MSSVLPATINEIFNEARQRYEDDQETKKKVEDRKSESHRNYVSPLFVEYPVADAIASPTARETGAEPDKSWFYVDLPPVAENLDLIKRLYQQPRTKYSYIYSQGGKNARLVNSIRKLLYS